MYKQNGNVEHLFSFSASRIWVYARHLCDQSPIKPACRIMNKFSPVNIYLHCHNFLPGLSVACVTLLGETCTCFPPYNFSFCWDPLYLSDIRRNTYKFTTTLSQSCVFQQITKLERCWGMPTMNEVKTLSITLILTCLCYSYLMH